MKTKLIMLMMMLSVPVSAQDFGGKNGGDVHENRFNQIANDIRDWISKGGSKGLQLPQGLDAATYERKMLDALNGYSVSFTTDKIMVNGVEKDCENTPNSRIIRCNIERFKNSNESEQYMITHHEFAGLAGLESNAGKASSDYSISLQITKSLRRVSVLRLAVVDNHCNYFQEPMLRDGRLMPTLNAKSTEASALVQTTMEGKGYTRVYSISRAVVKVTYDAGWVHEAGYYAHGQPLRNFLSSLYSPRAEPFSSISSVDLQTNETLYLQEKKGPLTSEKLGNDSALNLLKDLVNAFPACDHL